MPIYSWAIWNTGGINGVGYRNGTFLPKVSITIDNLVNGSLTWTWDLFLVDLSELFADSRDIILSLYLGNTTWIFPAVSVLTISGGCDLATMSTRISMTSSKAAACDNELYGWEHLYPSPFIHDTSVSSETIPFNIC